MLLLVLYVYTAALLLKSAQCQCSWEYYRSTVKCNLRILESQGLDLHVAETADRLDIQCSDTLFFESELPPRAFNNLQKLSELKIDSCKLLNLTSGVLNGLNSLKLLAINTHNSKWDNSKTFNINSNSLSTLRELQVIDFSHSNIRSLPEGIWCPLNNLQILNLTYNRLRSLENFGFSKLPCNGAGGNPELQLLDISYNELTIIPSNWAISSSLRRLQHLNLQFNNITQFKSDSFNGLSSLRILNLSYNHLESLPIDFLSNCKDLRELHLHHNELYDLPRNLLHQLEQLLVLDLSNNQLTSHHIDNTTFSGLVRLIVLNLANNALTRIGLNTFKELYFLQILDLHNNSIGHIENGSFLPLYNLHTLNLAENRIHTIDNYLFNGLFVLTKLTINNNLINIIDTQAFKNCSDLKELDLSSNQLTEIPQAINDLNMLKTLDLGENQIYNIQNGTFKNLLQLTGLRLIDNNIGNISKGMFSNLPKLSVLNLAKNRIQNIERGTFDENNELEAIRLDRNYLTDINGVFATLSSLLWLNLSENHLVWFDYAFIPSNLKWLDIHGNFIEKLGNYYKLQEEINLKTLDASHNRITEIGPMSVPNTIELLFINNNLINLIYPNTFVDKINLARVDLYTNMLTKLQLNSLRIAPMTNINNNNNKIIPDFYLGGNPFECDCTMEWLQRINNITTKQHPNIVDTENIDCLMPNNRNTPIKSLITLKSNDFLCKYDKHCFSLCHCCEFDNDCNCEAKCPFNCSCYNDYTWDKNIVDCGKQENNIIPSKIPIDVTELYLDGNDYPSLESHNFIKYKNLKTLYLNSSNIVIITNKTFFGLNILQELHLENNKLRYIERTTFTYTPKLQQLHLQNNHLTTIANNTFDDLKELQILRLDNNRLSTLAIDQLKLLQKYGNLQILTLGRNEWSCECKFFQEFTQFINDNKLIINDNQNVFCLDGTIKKEYNSNALIICDNQISNLNISSKEYTNSYIPLLAALLILIILIIILIIAFIYRETVRIWLFAHYGVQVCESRLDNGGKLYDAIILHSINDYDFVCRNIANELENGRPPLRLCIQHRDLPNNSTHLQLLEASRASRKIILVLTHHLLQTEWIRIDFRSAFHESLRGLLNKLVIIEETDINNEADDIIDLSSYLKIIPTNRILTSDQYFWEKLRYAIPVELTTRGNNYTIDHHERFKQPISPGVIFRSAPPPPAYYQDDTNYSSATTATPSPRPIRHIIHNDNNIQMRPPSEHIYSSIDSEYTGYDHENFIMIGNSKKYHHRVQKQQQQNKIPSGPGGGHQSNWRTLNTTHNHPHCIQNSSTCDATSSTVNNTNENNIAATTSNSGSNSGSGQAFLV